VGGFFDGNVRQPAAFMTARIPSFTDFLASYAPDLLPGIRGLDPLPAVPGGSDIIKDLPHATTIVAAACERGVVLAGDRRATMIRGNLGGAMQGLAVVPLFAGYDEETSLGRIFSYDVAGGPYEEHRYHSIGSGSVFAKSALKKLYRDDMSVSDAVLACVQALYDAADDDSATGGPDLPRRIFPVIAAITDDGLRRLPESETAEYAQQVVAERMHSPDGPNAPLRTAS